ncbi:uncharacterized protein BT62DRAFT_922697 [Guyanagaster necrorhizus]|uniref:Uncharacterized protein n=1 Tax=Guyanagaster necrorhizus TaxID=856835 RepID=A0A9P8APW3_9AGAR|nr:uncharacterized protein BT62DRAFT_922697 [Guyanagaster necrorhizus MCA 3950]KAG7442267.1 hypothetical protein BT62DRAFT_922697 [Guyanagaster necrorhizus MCA 3950]
MPMAPYDAIICDLSDLLFTWSARSNCTLSTELPLLNFSSSTWLEYEKGRISQETCYARLGHEFSLDPVDIRKAAEDSCASLKWDTNLENFFHGLKDENRETMCVFAMFNISQPGYEALWSVSADMNWSIFDSIFTSFAAGRRKPDLGFYRLFRAKEEVVVSMMDEMLMYVNEDGVIQTYFDQTRPQIDPVVCVNALSIFYSYGRGNEMNQTLEWVYQVLLHRVYIQGSRYCETAECFLFFLYRFISGCNNPVIHSRFYPLLKDRVTEKIGTEGDGLAFAILSEGSSVKMEDGTLV